MILTPRHAFAIIGYFSLAFVVGYTILRAWWIMRHRR